MSPELLEQHKYLPGNLCIGVRRFQVSMMLYFASVFLRKLPALLWLRVYHGCSQRAGLSHRSGTDSLTPLGVKSYHGR